jgi:hypothetical protein
MVEFALVAPVLLTLFFMLMDGTLLLFGAGTSLFSAGQGAILGAQLGNDPTADSQMVQTIRNSAVGQTALVQVNEVDIYKLNQDSSGNLTVDTTHYNRYRLDGSVIGTVTWPSTTRNVNHNGSDFMGITLDYQYPWRTGLFGQLPTPRMKATYYVRLEPQVY